MSTARTLAAAGAACLALVAVPAGAAAVSTPRADFRLELSSRKPATATDIRVHFLYKGKDPEAKPSPLEGLVITMPRGSRFDTGAVPRCDASDEELRSQGDAACPPESRLGGGVLTAITGFGPPVDPFRTDASIYNTADGFVEIVKDPQTGAPLGSDRFTIEGRVWTGHPPNTPGGPPDGRTAVREIDFTWAPKAAWAITPRRCPKSRRWRATATIAYADGTTVTVPHAVPCKRPRARARDGRRHHMRNVRG